MSLYFRKGDRRFRLPLAVPPYKGTLSATKYGPACPQQTASPLDLIFGTSDIAGPPLSPDEIDGALKISRLQATDVLESDEDCELDSSSLLNILAFADVYCLRSFDQRHQASIKYLDSCAATCSGRMFSLVFLFCKLKAQLRVAHSGFTAVRHDDTSMSCSADNQINLQVHSNLEILSRRC